MNLLTSSSLFSTMIIVLLLRVRKTNYARTLIQPYGDSLLHRLELEVPQYYLVRHLLRTRLSMWHRNMHAPSARVCASTANIVSVRHCSCDSILIPFPPLSHPISLYQIRHTAACRRPRRRGSRHGGRARAERLRYAPRCGVEFAVTTPASMAGMLW
jgi:hypothetical protein